MESTLYLNSVSSFFKLPFVQPQGIVLSTMTKAKKRKALSTFAAQYSTNQVGRYSKESKGAVIEKVQCHQRNDTALVDGLGIISFPTGKSIVITGATGFLAKGIVEKILRTAPDVGKIVLLIQAKNEEDARKRLEKEILDVEIFKLLKQEYGEAYASFMLSKLVPVAGNLREDGFGINPELATKIVDEVDIIVNLAGNTTFDERYDVSFDINVLGVYRLMMFAERCKKLQLLLHVSTAFVGGPNQGEVLEAAIGKEDHVDENGYPIVVTRTKQLLDIGTEMKLAFDSEIKADDKIQLKKMKDIGLSRARSYGWENTYSFTKAMGEMVIDHMRGDLPVTIIRPTVLESTMKDPFPGWIKGNRTIDPLIIRYGKGLLTSFPGDPNGVFDAIPADMVVNATLAAMAKDGGQAKPAMNIYHVSSSCRKPLLYSEVFEYIYLHFSQYPFIDSQGRPVHVERVNLLESLDRYLSNISTQTSSAASPKRSLRTQKKVMEHAVYLGNLFGTYTFYKGWFDDTNTHNLISAMSNEEREVFDFDVRHIDWKDYYVNIHIPGLRTHVLMGRGSPSKFAAQHGSV